MVFVMKIEDMVLENKFATNFALKNTIDFVFQVQKMF